MPCSLKSIGDNNTADVAFLVIQENILMYYDDDDDDDDDDVIGKL